MTEFETGAKATHSPGVQGSRGAWYLLGGSVSAAVASLIALASGPILFRAGALDLVGARTLTTDCGLYLSIAAGILALGGLTWSVFRRSSRGVIVGMLTLLVALLTGFRVIGFRVQVTGLPPIYEAQTDWSDPVRFSEDTLALRDTNKAAPVDVYSVIAGGNEKWSGMTFAAAQDQFFPDLKPLVVRLSPADTTKVAAEIADEHGWRVTSVDVDGGRIEAVSQSLWYGLVSDIAIRIVSEGEGARVDLHAASRVAAPDLGTNASLIKEFIDDLAATAGLRARQKSAD